MKVGVGADHGGFEMKHSKSSSRSITISSGCTRRWAIDPRKNSSERPKTKPNHVAHGWSLL
jgi:hypothetical protein